MPITYELVPIRTRNWAYVTPKVEAPFILPESLNRCTLIFHHVFMFMAIDIHPILLFPYFHPSSPSQQCAVHSEIACLSMPESTNQACISGLKTTSINVVASMQTFFPFFPKASQIAWATPSSTSAVVWFQHMWWWGNSPVWMKVSTHSQIVHACVLPCPQAFAVIIKAFVQLYPKSSSKNKFKNTDMAWMQARTKSPSLFSLATPASSSWAICSAVWSQRWARTLFAHCRGLLLLGTFPWQRSLSILATVAVMGYGHYNRTPDLGNVWCGERRGT